MSAELDGLPADRLTDEECEALAVALPPPACPGGIGFPDLAGAQKMSATFNAGGGGFWFAFTCRNHHHHVQGVA